MVNTIINQIRFHASSVAIDWFEEKIQDLDFIEYKYKSQKFIDLFGDQNSDTNFEKIGCEWLVLDDCDWYREDDETYFMQYKTANLPPIILIKNIVDLLKHKSDRDYWCYAYGRYWDNDILGETIGIFECSEDGYYYDEVSIDIDRDDMYYWENQVEVAFESLQI